jgi:8-oxo-dGTP pyrophosphatase MutT (NUDIX family)
MFGDKCLQVAIRKFRRASVKLSQVVPPRNPSTQQLHLSAIPLDRCFSSSAQFADEKSKSEGQISKSRPFSSSVMAPQQARFLRRKVPLSPTSAAVPKAAENREHQRIWIAHSLEEPLFWSDDVVNGAQSDPHDLANLLERIERQELEGGRMKSKQSGVLHEDPAVDMRLLTENYTVTSLASALRDREDVLQHCAQMAQENKLEELQAYLKMFHPDMVMSRRNQKRQLDVSKPLSGTSLEIIRKALMRMPRRVVQAHSRRAGVVIPIVHVDGVPSLLLEKRSPDLRAHPDEVCLPGGMVCSVSDKTIVETCLREFKEEIGGLEFDYHQNGGVGSHGVSVLGVLRCNWGEVHHMVGVAVTPVVCYFSQDLAEVDLKPNPDEVAEVFTIPLAGLLDRSQWVYKEDHAPIFIGGPYIIWGLTGFLLDRFTKDVLLPFQHPDKESQQQFE